MKLTEITENPENPRTIDKGKFQKLKNSIKEFPKMMALRPIVTNDDGMVLGGNMRLKALRELGYDKIPDDWVKKASDLTEDEKRQFIIVDNVGFGEWDWDVLANDWNPEELADWGLIVPDYFDPYTHKVETPEYKPINEKPEIADLYDMDKARELYAEIEGSDIPDEEKEFLKAATSRHIVFNYSNIADYYAHSDKKVQNLIERSALVIIDFDKAIQQGFVQLSKRINNLYSEDHDGE
jgi:hypothetical protein